MVRDGNPLMRPAGIPIGCPVWRAELGSAWPGGTRANLAQAARLQVPISPSIEQGRIEDAREKARVPITPARGAAISHGAADSQGVPGPKSLASQRTQGKSGHSLPRASRPETAAHGCPLRPPDASPLADYARCAMNSPEDSTLPSSPPTRRRRTDDVRLAGLQARLETLVAESSAPKPKVKVKAPLTRN